VKEYRAALLAVALSLPSLIAAIAGYVEARAQHQRAETKAMDLQRLADNYGDYVRDQMREGCTQ